MTEQFITYRNGSSDHTGYLYDPMQPFGCIESLVNKPWAPCMIFARPYVTGWNPITIMILKIHDCNKTFPRHIESSLRLHTSLTRPVCNLWPTHIHPFWSIYESGLNRYVPCDIILTRSKPIYTGYFDRLYRIATKNLYLILRIIEHIFL
jgi:hypothetical protein